MQCGGFNSDSYDLYSLGLLEDEESAQIGAHLQDKCQTCSHALGESRKLWYSFGTVQAADSAERPSKQLRSRILASVGAKSNCWFTLDWARPIATAAAVFLAVGIGWFAGTQHAPTANVPPTVLTVQKGFDQGEFSRLQSEIRTLQERAAATPQPTVQIPAPQPGLTADQQLVLRNLQGQLEEARNTAAASDRALREAQTRQQQLEADLQQQRSQLSAAVKDRDDIQVRLTNAAAENARLRTQEQQIATLTARVQQLDRERTRLENVVSTQQQKLDQNLRLASVLTSPTLKLVQLRGTESAPGANGHALVADGQKVVFYATNLPSLAPGKVYQLWLLRGQSPAVVSGGLFTAETAQTTVVEFTDRALTSRITGIAVTDEPAGGSKVPTGHKFLVGTPRT
jgi:hypothetical protein